MNQYISTKLRNCIIFLYLLTMTMVIFGCRPGLDSDIQTTSTQINRVALSTVAPITVLSTPTLAATFTPVPTKTQFILSDPSLKGPITIGWSVEGRKIQVYRFGTGETERLIVAGIHGGAEWNTTSLANLLINSLREHPEMVPASISLYILPVLNPDGAARPDDDTGRTNAHNVDLNRNWDANWKADWPRAGCWNQLPTTGGTKPMSEPETIALANFIKLHHFDAIISYHSAGLGIFAGGLPSTPASISLAKAIAAVSTYPYPPIDTGCVYTGAFVDWAANQGIAALDVELSDHADTDFNINLKILKTFLGWKE